VVDLDIPVMGHIGLTPQSVHKFGGYKVQGKGRAEAKDIIRDARLLEKAGAFAIVLECIPAALAREVTKAVSVPTIGIGAGPYCNGQVLVINDMLGLNAPADGSEKRTAMPRFVKKYADLYLVMTKAVCEFKEEVESGKFPSKEHCY
jgi:3-methyl-2-oxobutanoate hydroxymethyltransferase